MPRTQELPEVLEVREEIARLDHSLVMLVAARQDAVHRLFDVKRRAGRPIFDPAQEAAVIARARRWAREVGAHPDEAEAVFERLVQVSKHTTARRRAGKESETVTVMLAMPPALPKVRVERSMTLSVPTGPNHHRNDDHSVGPADDHHAGPDRRPRPTTHHELTV
jgi:chorismate mutase